MNDDDIDFIIEAVKLISAYGWKLLPQYIVNPETGEWKHEKNLVSEIQCEQGISYGSCLVIVFILLN